jgi:probable F420-dependent oxidoreductase
MQLGVVFPQHEIGSDVGAIRAYAEAAEDLGYRHVIAYDHILGANKEVHTELDGPYDINHTFHEPFVLFGFLAGFTSLEFATGILIAPQRQTALIAKQAAEVDLLSGGNRLRLGVGVGWNTVEYEALGQDFASRGKRLEYQVALLRLLWTEKEVSSQDPFDTVTAAGLAPLPLTQPIPIWMGGNAPAALDRIGRIADGWFPMAWPGHGLEASLEKITESRARAGRSHLPFGIEGQLAFSADLDKTMDFADKWRAAGTTHLSVNTMYAGFDTVDGHIDALATVAASFGLK